DLLRERHVSASDLVPALVAEGVATEDEIRGSIADPGITGAVQMVDAVLARASRPAAAGPADAEAPGVDGRVS
ncbi:MAG TPA: hypothetical protein VLC50_04905, partial [Actinomycetes bacterium]|nr:hypothetical protein [Actinomycetes bacterium]